MEVRSNPLLHLISLEIRKPSYIIVSTHRSQCYRGGGQTDQTSISRVWLVNSIGIIVAELIDNLLDFIVLSSEYGIADDLFKPKNIPGVSTEAFGILVYRSSDVL